jgi:acyl carrier protein
VPAAGVAAYRKALLAGGRVDDEKLGEIELSIEADSLDIVEIIIALE